MLGFKTFRRARTLIAGIELMHRIRKGHFNLAARFKEATGARCSEESSFGLIS